MAKQISWLPRKFSGQLLRRTGQLAGMGEEEEGVGRPSQLAVFAEEAQRPASQRPAWLRDQDGPAGLFCLLCS